ncbi:MAG: TolC family protein [Endomicrobia bacterium]|nr:TolC family protein [Endomicrobiia bacterium]
MKISKVGILSGLLTVTAIAGFSAGANAEMLTIQQYMDLVAKENSKLKSVEANIEAVRGKIAQIEQVYSYFLSAGANYLNDKSGRPYSPLNQINGLSNFSYDASVNKQFETGTTVTLGLNGSYGQYNYLSGLGYHVNDLAPFVSVRQSLLKDFNGGATKASMSKARADANSALYLLLYQKQQIILSARLAYWNLSYTRTVIDFRQTSLARTQKLLEWNQKRFNLDLAEKTDLLQSQAAVKMGELNCKLAVEDEVRASRVFNGLINIAKEKVQYDVQNFIDAGRSFNKDVDLSRTGNRADVLSALENVKSAEYDQIYSQKSLSSDLIVSGQAALNGVTPDFDKAADYVVNGDKPSYSIGLRYTLPLNFNLRKNINTGFQSAIEAAMKAEESAQIQETNDWLQLVDNWNNAKSRYALSTEIRDIQQKRDEENQSLLKKGRSTTYLVLQSEQDLDDSTLNMLRNIFELMNIYEQASAFYNTEKF